ncbi:aminotransferase-like domain-containing protein [Micromonospora okii]|uniref:aminotransferase-like domain-containing protein n=1 Tax=Micromonospora okii TaxID=1182970 RepID=UPI001E39741B|nr:PLP-dependent aminotransferase family protein [Micromonospora okii]
MTGAVVRVRLDEELLHPSLRDPALSSIGFLNEVMNRYPEAISFAPGAPDLSHLADTDLAGYVDAYLAHVRQTRGIGPERARRLLHEYGPSAGLINDLVAAALRADGGPDVPPEAIVVTVGAQEAMLLVLRALFRDGADVLAVTSPCFPGITGAARMLDIAVAPFPESAGGPDLERLAVLCAEARSRNQRVRAVYVAPDYANPSGARMSLLDRRCLLALAEREDLLVVEDNVYGFTAPPGHELPGLKDLDETGRVVMVGSFAKVCLPGARVGFVVADQTVRGPAGDRLLAAELAALKGMTTVNTAPVCQAVVGGMLLRHGGSLAALGRARAGTYQRNMRRLLDALERHVAPVAPPGVRWNRPGGGFFVLMDLPVPADLALLSHCAERYGVLWTPMAGFHPDGGGRHRLRLSCSYLTEDRIEEGVARLARFLSRLPSHHDGAGVSAPTRTNRTSEDVTR